jgi:hypothetical protein
MRCPICHKDVPWAGNSFRPFFSQRCQLIDLDHWLSERYRISTPVDSQDEKHPGGEAEQDEKGGSG